MLTHTVVRTIPWSLILCLTGLACVVAGCGDDDDAAQPTAGTSGSAGASGANGASGTSGSNGSSGSSGSNGASGSSGSNGANGSSGVSGASAGDNGAAGTTAGNSGTGGAAGNAGSAGSTAGSGNAGNAGTGNTSAAGGPPAGNPDGNCAVPDAAKAEDVSSPDHVVGTGTPDSCTGAAFVAAVALGGVITFDCGPDPVTITLSETAKIFNDKGPKIVIDGGNKVTLSGGGTVRILYQNTCDQNQVWTTSHCDNQDSPQLSIQNLTFVDGNAKNEEDGGGAIFVRGGQFKVNNSRFFNNVCADVGPDVGGGAIRVFDQFQDQPVYIVHSTFGGEEALGNVCSNGAGLSSIGVSYTVINTLMSHNKAIGNGANPAQSGTPGGGSGGAIYNDGNTYTLTLCGDKLENNHANEGGGAIFFVSNDLSGHLIIQDSVLSSNPSDGFETQGYPGIFYLGNGDPQVSGSTLE